MPPRRRRPAPTAPAGFADQLRQVIAGRGLTAYSVARAASVAPSVVSRFLSRERGLTLETFDAIAGALGLRLVEGGRGRGRPARVGPGETHRYPEMPTTRPGPDALHFLTEIGDQPSVEPVSDGPVVVVDATDAMPEGARLEAASAPDENSTNFTPGEADSRIDGAKRPSAPAFEDPAEAIGHMVMDDDGAPPIGPAETPSPGAVWH